VRSPKREATLSTSLFVAVLNKGGTGEKKEMKGTCRSKKRVLLVNPAPGGPFVLYCRVKRGGSRGEKGGSAPTCDGKISLLSKQGKVGKREKKKAL